MTVRKNISTTSGLGNCSKSSNRDPGLNQASDEGSDFESEANSRPDSPGEQKTKENEPPSKMQKIDSTNSGAGTLHLNEQRPKQQSCISFQKEPNTTMPNTESNMKNMMSMLEKILISVDANRKTNSVPVNVQSDPYFRKYDFKSFSDLSEIAANAEDIVFVPTGNNIYSYTNLCLI